MSEKAPQRNFIINCPNEAERPHAMAELAADPVMRNVIVADMFNKDFGELDYAESLRVLRDRVGEVNRGNMENPEAMLVAQANSLDVLFSYLSRLAAGQLAKNFGVAETLLRLALKAQNQSRATLQTLGELKSPRVVFAQQANFAHGHQQVNNGEAHAVARVEKRKPPIKLLENQQRELQGVDAGKTRKASACDQAVAAVESVDRPAHRKRKTHGKP